MLTSSSDFLSIAFMPNSFNIEHEQIQNSQIDSVGKKDEVFNHPIRCILNFFFNSLNINKTFISINVLPSWFTPITSSKWE